ncbi:MAG: hypothetical protein ACFBZ9_14530 [Sphingomonadales bacterium]
MIKNWLALAFITLALAGCKLKADIAADVSPEGIKQDCLAPNINFSRPVGL